MHPLNVYGYHVRYGYSSHKEKEYKIHEEVCFSPLFSSNCKAKYYEIYILKGEADLNRYHSNYCFFDKKQIQNHLKQIPKFCNIKFEITETKYKGDDAFKLNFFIDSDNRLVHKYTLTWIRSLFEWPYYLYLVHAKKMKNLPEFRFESVINLFNVVATVHRNSFAWNVHTFGVDLGLLRKSQIVKRVNEKKADRVNTVFPRTHIDKMPQCKLVEKFEDITENLFQENLPRYIEAYHLLKAHENNDNRK